MLRERFRCPHFRILVIGRANAGKTTILEKVCGVAKGTKPIIYDKNGKPSQIYALTHVKWYLGEKLQQSKTHLLPSIGVSQMINLKALFDMHIFQRGLHDIEHQITYPGCNFIFHDSQGFESGSTQELESAWKFIEERSTRTELKDQLHAIWYIASILHAYS